MRTTFDLGEDEEAAQFDSNTPLISSTHSQYLAATIGNYSCNFQQLKSLNSATHDNSMKFDFDNSSQFFPSPRQGDAMFPSSPSRWASGMLTSDSIKSSNVFKFPDITDSVCGISRNPSQHDSVLGGGSSSNSSKDRSSAYDVGQLLEMYRKVRF